MQQVDVLVHRRGGINFISHLGSDTGVSPEFLV